VAVRTRGIAVKVVAVGDAGQLATRLILDAGTRRAFVHR
jgi:hypothetical protein